MGRLGPSFSVVQCARRRSFGRAARIGSWALTALWLPLLARADLAHEATSPPETAQPHHSIATSATHSTAERAAADPVWRALLHQQRRSIDRETRESLAAADFFFHERGASEARLELLATRDAMRQADRTRAQAARCRFPARHRFLAERGLLSRERGPCPRLEDWRDTIGDVELTLVFPEAFLGNPSSMFGHTLLRFDPITAGADDSGEDLLGWTLDFTADAGEDTGLFYMASGLLGGYQGRFTVAPYYEKTRVYSDWQDRDIWEYPLGMSREAVELVLLHVWELRGVELPYYFFKQNCSERLLEVLQVGWPSLGRGGGMPPGVTPVDTLRAMAAISPDAVGQPRYRASPATRLQASLRAVDADRAELIEALASGRLQPDARELAALPTEDRARVLTLAYDLLRHSFLAGRETAEASRDRSNALLRARSQLRAPAAPRPLDFDAADRVPPDQGHGSARVALRGGLQDREGFIELRFQPAFHNALDAPGGFAEGGEIKFLDTALRYFPERNRVRLHELQVFDVTTASPWRRPFRPLAWHTEIGLRSRIVSRERKPGLEAAPVFRAQGGLGAAFAPLRQMHVYAFGELVVEAAPVIEGNASAGPIVRSGLTWSSRRGRYTLRLEGVAGVLAGRESSDWLGAKLEQRVSLSRNWSVVLGGHFERAYGVGHFEGRFGVTRYF